MGEPIKLVTFGQTTFSNGSTVTTPNGIDTATPNTKVDTESNNNRVDLACEKQTDSQDSARDAKECNSLLHETAIDIPAPPPPPAVQSSGFAQPKGTSTVATEATAGSIDTDTVTSKQAESISVGTVQPAPNKQAAAAAAVSPWNEESNASVARGEKGPSSTPIQLSTFSSPASAVAQTHVTTPDVQDAKRDEAPKLAEGPSGGIGTLAAPSAGDTGARAATASLSTAGAEAEAEAEGGAWPGTAARGRDDGEGAPSSAGAPSGVGAPPRGDVLMPAVVALSDDADGPVEGNSLDSSMKLASFDAEMTTIFVKGDGDQSRRYRRARFVALCSMALATVMLILVAVGLVLLVTFEDISKILGDSGEPVVAMQRVVMIGEGKIEKLQFSSPYTDQTSEGYESLQRDFIKSIEGVFEEHSQAGVYRSTRVSGFRRGSVIVSFEVLLSPTRRPGPAEDPRPRRAVYEEARATLKMHLRSVTINSTRYNVSAVRLVLKFGSELVSEAPSATTQPSQVTLARATASSFYTRMTEGYQSRSADNTADQPSASTGTSDQTGTTRASTSAAPASTNEVTDMPGTGTNQTTVSAIAISTNAGSAPATVGTTARMTMMTNETRARRSTRFITDMWTTRLVTKQSSSPASLAPKATDGADVTVEGCFARSHRECVLRGLSPNATRTPNRFGLGRNTSRLWDELAEEGTASADDPMTWRVACSLLAPSCDARLLGPRLPCRSACLAVVDLLRDTGEARALGALCNETLPESGSETICFKSPDQNQTGDTPTESPCSALLCQNGGTCFDMNNRYYCRCPDSVGGLTCDIDPCNPNPCQNGAICHGLAEFITSYICACREGYQGTHCELTTAEPLPSYTPKPDVHVPVDIDSTECRGVLPYNRSYTGAKVPDWRLVAPLASCSDAARLAFCVIAFPEWEEEPAAGRLRAPCRALCRRVIAECGALFTVMGRDFPGICERLGTEPTEVEDFCTLPPL